MAAGYLSESRPPRWPTGNAHRSQPASYRVDSRAQLRRTPHKGTVLASSGCHRRKPLAPCPFLRGVFFKHQTGERGRWMK